MLLFPTRRSYFVLAVAFSAFAIYVSLLPFDLDHRPLENAWTEFQHALRASPRISRTDFLANVLLFVPIGFSLAGSLCADRASRSRLWLTPFAIVPFSMAVSIAAEFMQTFAAERVPSRTDIGAQAIGSILGIAAWAIAGPGLTRWIRTTLASTQDDRLSRALAGFAAVWLFVNLAPFDVTFDPGDLAQRVRSGRVTLIPYGNSDMAMTRRVWDALAETLSAMPLGMLGLARFQGRRSRSPASAFALGATFVLLTELAQIFIRSHSADSADAAFGWLGVAAGVWIGRRVVSQPQLPAARATSGLFPPALIGIAIWVLVLCAYHWLPYTFEFDGRAIRQKLARVSLLPFAAYLRGSPLNAFNDLLTKVALSVPLGLIATFVLRPTRHLSTAVMLVWTSLAGCIFGAIEIGQFFLPTRSPDPTDVLIGVIGTLSGLMVAHWIWDQSRSGGNHDG